MKAKREMLVKGFLVLIEEGVYVNHVISTCVYFVTTIMYYLVICKLVMFMDLKVSECE